ncbi:MAG: hypothetical protein F4139_16190 [Gemmatimonadetes bacterium]|nr:hypothetical protein [Gemmatimonadota bacterium]MYA63812.1 hypothetical protein [Gemmatimonadota bacterium]MYB97475.1 hypothetical protein [Gemmatimonadota bacterium]MYH54455.1 hypothetical protein [Gemmatimonadota bacterium]MYI45133.1 hypothetical protein [Gemmatimonadota bacterium]
MTLRPVLVLAFPTLATTLLTAPPLPAQETVQLSGEDRLLEADFEELYRVGSMQGDHWDTFGLVVDVAFDESGNLYVFDSHVTRFSVIGMAGNLVRQFGRVGEGPGEFGARSAIVFTVLHDRRIAAFDPVRRHFVVFGPDGAYESQLPLGGTGTTWAVIPGLQADLGSGSVVSTGEVGYLGATQGPDGEPVERPGRYVMRYTVGGDGVAVDTAARGWKPPEDHEFSPGLSAGVLPDGGVAFVDSSAYAIKVAGQGGEVSRVLTRPIRAVPVTEDMRAAHIDRELEDLQAMADRGDETQKAMAEFLRAQLESTEFFHEVPVIRSLRTSPEGTIWVRRTGGEPGSNGPIDLISMDGRYLGSFAPEATGLPSAFGPDGLVAFVERNDLDVQTVIVRRLPKEIR